jgi:hypothetical protein
VTCSAIMMVVRFVGALGPNGMIDASTTIRASCAWVESERDSRISEILIQPVGFRGGQQEMAKPYSQDLRDRVIDAVKRGEMSRRAAARRYEISESVAIKWLKAR